MKKKTLVSWSSGKDSAWALHSLRQQPDVEIVGLFSTVNQEFERVAMHAVRNELVRQQAKSLGLPIQLIQIPYPCDNSAYRVIMQEFIAQAKQQGVECIAFGDLFLEDVRKYREDNLDGTGIKPIFPLWGMPTDELSREMVKSGLHAIITCIDPNQLPPGFSGREYEDSFLSDLPDQVDPCGENGEFHSFVYDGPMFKEKITVRTGETLSRDGFVFTDLFLEQDTPPL
jgi:uncharacterized protein (TIGR00290 family)